MYSGSRHNEVLASWTCQEARAERTAHVGIARRNAPHQKRVLAARITRKLIVANIIGRRELDDLFGRDATRTHLNGSPGLEVSKFHDQPKRTYSNATLVERNDYEVRLWVLLLLISTFRSTSYLIESVYPPVGNQTVTAPRTRTRSARTWSSGGLERSSHVALQLACSPGCCSNPIKFKFTRS
jgi:hypothetical protein